VVGEDPQQQLLEQARLAGGQRPDQRLVEAGAVVQARAEEQPPVLGGVQRVAAPVPRVAALLLVLGMGVGLMGVAILQFRRAD
jgi:hypothetical protein